MDAGELDVAHRLVCDADGFLKRRFPLWSVARVDFLQTDAIDVKPLAVARAAALLSARVGAGGGGFRGFFFAVFQAIRSARSIAVNRGGSSTAARSVVPLRQVAATSSAT